MPTWAVGGCDSARQAMLRLNAGRKKSEVGTSPKLVAWRVSSESSVSGKGLAAKRSWPHPDLWQGLGI